MIQRTIAGTLRFVAQMVRVDDAAMLLEIAEAVENWSPANNIYSCPLCEEDICDDGCPMAPARAAGSDIPPHPYFIPRVSVGDGGVIVQTTSGWLLCEPSAPKPD